MHLSFTGEINKKIPYKSLDTSTEVAQVSFYFLSSFNSR